MGRMRQRRPELAKAEAVISKPARPGSTPPGASNLSQISLNTRAVRWLDQRPAH
jgi:hypothetical protein